MKCAYLTKMSPYDFCRLWRLSHYDVCHIMMFFVYDVCRIITFVNYDVCHLFECVAYIGFVAIFIPRPPFFWENRTVLFHYAKRKIPGIRHPGNIGLTHGLETRFLVGQYVTLPVDSKMWLFDIINGFYSRGRPKHQTTRLSSPISLPLFGVVWIIVNIIIVNEKYNLYYFCIICTSVKMRPPPPPATRRWYTYIIQSARLYDKTFRTGHI